jgi:LPXTG-motif cell wall-anchored protein
MKFRMLAVSLLVTLAGGLALSASPAQATQNLNPCNVQGMYVNDDEQGDAPTRGYDGFFFDNKDLIHHQTAPIDLPDIKKTTLSFVSDTPGKVVGKMETENPYSTIVQQADGKFWSTAMTYDQIGGQGHPVENVSDLVGTDENPRPTKPGKAEYGITSHVVTFGVGYWVVDGNATVSSITFHGVTYVLSCKKSYPTVTPTTPSTSSSTPTATATKTTPESHGAVVGGGTSGTTPPALAVTGSSTTTVVIVAGFLMLGGVMLYIVSRRRKNKFIS